MSKHHNVFFELCVLSLCESYFIETMLSNASILTRASCVGAFTAERLVQIARVHCSNSVHGSEGNDGMETLLEVVDKWVIQLFRIEATPIDHGKQNP